MADTIITRDNVMNLPVFKGKKVQEMNGCGGENEKIQIEQVEIKFEDVRNEPLFHSNNGEYNPETHVQVRILSKRSLPVDLNTGILKKQKTKKPT